MTAALFPLLYLTLELPKRIINDAIGAQSNEIEVLGISLTQIEFLAMLCAAFLLSVLAHGLVKMRINTMKGILADIQSGKFADEWIAEHRSGSPNFNALREAAKGHQSEVVGAHLRGMMPWMQQNRLVDKAKN